MYRNILVPLDGSIYGECVLPHVRSIAAKCDIVDITLIRVVAPVAPYYWKFITTETEFWGSVTSEPDIEKIMETAEQNATEDAAFYLKRVASQFDVNNATVRTAVVVGETVDTIVSYVRNNGIDLIIMASDRNSWLSRLILGSRVQGILRSACAAVLVVQGTAQVACTQGQQEHRGLSLAQASH